MYRAAKVMGISLAEAELLDNAEINRILLYAGAELTAKAKAEHDAVKDNPKRLPGGRILRRVGLHGG